LATLRGRVDALEARTAELEANQFSTTTKLRGEAIFSVSQAFGDKQADQDNNPNNNPNLDSNITFSNRVRLSLESSFMGTDVLQTRLNAGNIFQLDGGSTSTNNPRPNITGTNMTRLGHDGNDNNSVTIDKLNYTFNLSEKIRVRIDAVGGELNENVNVFNPDFRSSGSGALSRYGRFSPIYRQARDGAGITVNVNPQGALTLSAAYYATGRNNAANPADGSGLFDGNNTIFGQLAFRPSKSFNVGLAYARTYQGAGNNLFGSTGSSFANRPFGRNTRTEADNYGLQLSLNPSAKVTLGGWVGYTTANAVTAPTNRDADMFYWGTTLGWKDFGREGNTLGLVFGQPPKVTGGSGGITKEASTSYHLEGLYKMKVSDNILITPGLLVIFNPEHNDKNDTIYVGTLRTTFSF
ncbi:MAG: iron uptake porin, partial [Sphaerospermopsis kisseleviana]